MVSADPMDGVTGGVADDSGSERPNARRTDHPSTWDRRATRSARLEFDASVLAPSRTRDFVASTARGWGLGDVGALAELLVSEIVTNAVEHGGSGGVVELEALPAGIRVAVTDSSFEQPAMRHPGNDEPSGRGLSIVDRLSRWWGVEPRLDGKTVWFEVDDVGTDEIW